MDINAFVTRYWNPIAAQNEEELRKYFHEDACVRWHNTGEKMVSLLNGEKTNTWGSL